MHSRLSGTTIVIMSVHAVIVAFEGIIVVQSTISRHLSFNAVFFFLISRDVV